MSDAVLLVEDTPSLQLVYASVLRGAGFDVLTADTAQEGYDVFAAHRPRAVLLDLRLPDRCGLDLMRDILAIRPATAIVVITANGSISKAVEAMRAGAFEFLVKPFDERRMLGAMRNALEAGRAAAESTPQAPDPAPLSGFIGSSPEMQKVYCTLRSAARSMATIFITGESGTGKEICAQSAHAASGRASGPFVPLNCGAIPSELLESEVFGHLKGAFTGAIADKMGAAAAADGGTLFLDEICEMDLSLQTKLLRFLQTSTIQPVGAVRPRKVSVRIICATNRDPVEEVRLGRFREDLFYRLHVVPIHLPPLRERGDDVIEIAEAALARLSREEGKSFTGLDDEVRKLFRDLPWPGNVRQVLNALRNVVVLHDGPLVTRAMLPAGLERQRRAPRPPETPGTTGDAASGTGGRRDTEEHAETADGRPGGPQAPAAGGRGPVRRAEPGETGTDGRAGGPGPQAPASHAPLAQGTPPNGTPPHETPPHETPPHAALSPDGGPLDAPPRDTPPRSHGPEPRPASGGAPGDSLTPASATHDPSGPAGPSRGAAVAPAAGPGEGTPAPAEAPAPAAPAPGAEPDSLERTAILSSTAADPLDLLHGLTLAEIERRVIERTILRHGGSVPKAARELGVSPSTLYRKRDAWSSEDAR